MITLGNIKDRLDTHTLVRAIDPTKKGAFRLETAFLYPDGGSVDVFLIEDAPPQAALKLSDLGQTTSWLLDMQVKAWLSKKRQLFVEDALRNYGVVQSGGAFELPLESIDSLVDGIVRLGQACVRVSDLIYTRRCALQTGLDEELEEFLSNVGMPFDANVELVGRRGTSVRVDFVVIGARAQSAILGLASGSTSQAHVAANEIFRRWYDLDTPDRTEQRVTVFDDRYDVYRNDDLVRLRDLSDVVALSDRQSLQALLAA